MKIRNVTLTNFRTFYGTTKIEFSTDSERPTTIFIGEKHIPNSKFGITPDTSIFNGDHGAAARKAGVGALLAKGPSDLGANFGSYHSGVCQFVMGDGSVKALINSIDATNLGRLANREDGQVLTLPD